MKNSDYTIYFEKVSDTLKKIDQGVLDKMVQAIFSCREKGKTIYIFGNGGSAATASHIAGDFMKGISYQLEKRFKVMCLSDNIPGISAISNDLSYDEVFIEPLKSFLTKNDMVIGISGSGNSVNVVKAMEYAKSVGAVTVAVCGFKGGKIKDIADIAVHVPVNDMEVAEDIHLVIFHAVKQNIIKQLKGDSYSMGYNYDQRVQ
ncbi:MAG: SIS domain-containing protein [Bacteroidales bacterium]|nr:SIS domain-containing protein [Bacteroidales bacterium]